MKANFIKRFLAYFIDLVIVIFIFSIVTMGISNTKVQKLQELLVDVQEEIISNDIEDMEDSVLEYISLEYDIQEASMVTNTIYVILLFAYFTAFQYMNKGQTIGKKIMRIKIVKDGNVPGFGTVLVRSLIINEIIVNLLGIILLFVFNDVSYFMVYGIFSFVYLVIVIISVFMILFRNDKCGIHDMLTKSSVVEV